MSGRSNKAPKVLVASTLGGGLLGYALARIALHGGDGALSLRALGGLDLLALPFLALLVIAVHEAGHLGMGMGRGMRFLMFIAGPFGLVASGDGVRFRWFFNLGTMGGVAATLPDPARPLAPQMIPMVLGGPLASLLLGAAALAIAWSGDGRLAAYALLTGLLSLAIFAVTALPFRAGGFMSDGMQWLAYRRGGADVERRARLTALMGQSVAGTRPRDLDIETLRLAQHQAADGDVLCAIGTWFYSYAVALDNGDLDAAAGWLDRMVEVLDQYPQGFRQGICIELAIFEALYRRRADVARDWLTRARGGIVDASRRHIAEAALATLEGRSEDALQALENARQRRHQAMDVGMSALGEDQASLLRSRLQTDAAPAMP